MRFILDRAGLVGNDGPTHHGVFDLAYMGCLPDIVIMAPSDEVGGFDECVWFCAMPPALRQSLFVRINDGKFGEGKAIVVPFLFSFVGRVKLYAL